MGNNIVIEYNILTDVEDFITEDKKEAQDYFDNLPEEDKKSCQYFSKQWVLIGNDGHANYQEDEVIILKPNWY